MSLDTRWSDLLKGNDGQFFQRIDDSHPLDIYIGKEASGEPALLLVTDSKPPPSHQYQAIHLVSRSRHDGRWAVLFKLVRPELIKMFFLLCDDLVESCRHVPHDENPVARLMNRFTRWQRLLDRGHDGLLSDQALRGLIGELIVLRDRLLPNHEALAAMMAWVGPMGANQDFSFIDRLIEIKTIRTGASSVKVSSAEQLDIANIPIRMIVVTIDNAETPSERTFTVLSLIKQIEAIIESSPDATDLFDSRLIEAGFLRRDEYDDLYFVLQGTRDYEVTPGFPAIMRSQIPSGIGRLEYEITLDACAPFEVISGSTSPV